MDSVGPKYTCTRNSSFLRSTARPQICRNVYILCGVGASIKSQTAHNDSALEMHDRVIFKLCMHSRLHMCSDACIRYICLISARLQRSYVIISDKKESSDWSSRTHSRLICCLELAPSTYARCRTSYIGYYAILKITLSCCISYRPESCFGPTFIHLFHVHLFVVLGHL